VGAVKKENREGVIEENKGKEEEKQRNGREKE
jgi:hypothetical protein